MPLNRLSVASRVFVFLSLLALLACAAPFLLAQKTVEQDAGGGRKMVMDYNAAEQVVETRTLGADGKVQQRTVYVRNPGYLNPEETTTAYFANGKPSKITRVTYDASANFTGEFIQVYDETGKQIAGHKLTHDPMTNTYSCAEWDTPAQNYKQIECPAGEESGNPEVLKKFTYEEVMQHLKQARQTAAQERKQKRMLPMTPVRPPITTTNKEVGLVLPAAVRPGERISGSVVENPEAYEGQAGVTVTRVAVPFVSVGEASRLFGWTVETPGEKPQLADTSFSFVVPRGSASQVEVTLRQQGNPAHFVSKKVSFPGSSEKAQQFKSFVAPALCLKGQLCMVSGTFSGDSSQTFAAFEDRPATIVAEAARAVFIAIPEATEPGSRPLFLDVGAKVVGFQVAVGSFFVKNVERELQPGQTLITFPTLEGPGDIPDGLWRDGNYPPSNLEQARQLIPGFQIPHLSHAEREKREAQEREIQGNQKQKGESKEQREEDEKKGGMLLLVLKNMLPEQASMRGEKDHMIIFRLNDDSFSRGEFKYDLVMESLKPGHFAVKGYVLTFLAPVAGQEFPNKEAAAGN